MTETSTKTENSASTTSSSSVVDQSENGDDLDSRDQRFYTVISKGLNLIQVLPKHETVLKIITYSKTHK